MTIDVSKQGQILTFIPEDKLGKTSSPSGRTAAEDAIRLLLYKDDDPCGDQREYLSHTTLFRGTINNGTYKGMGRAGSRDG